MVVSGSRFGATRPAGEVDRAGQGDLPAAVRAVRPRRIPAGLGLATDQRSAASGTFGSQLLTTTPLRMSSTFAMPAGVPLAASFVASDQLWCAW